MLTPQRDRADDEGFGLKGFALGKRRGIFAGSGSLVKVKSCRRKHRKIRNSQNQWRNRLVRDRPASVCSPCWRSRCWCSRSPWESASHCKPRRPLPENWLRPKNPHPRFPTISNPNPQNVICPDPTGPRETICFAKGATKPLFTITDRWEVPIPCGCRQNWRCEWHFVRKDSDCGTNPWRSIDPWRVLNNPCWQRRRSWDKAAFGCG